jgi:hypothetical protein
MLANELACKGYPSASNTGRCVIRRQPDGGRITIAPPIASQFQALSSDRQSPFVDYVAEGLAGYVDDAGSAVPMENHFLTAVKP